MMTPTRTKLDFGLNRLQRQPDLTAIPGLTPSSDNHWHWALKDRSARLIAEPDGTLHVELGLARWPSVSAATELNAKLPGNLRFALRGRDTLLLAETIIDGQVHLPQTFAALATGMLAAAEGTPLPAPASGIVDQHVADAIRAVDWHDEQVVELADGWELRPRVRGCAVPVKATVDHTELRLHRTVVNQVAVIPVRHAIDEQALRFNARLKHARLAFRDNGWCAETRLCGQQLTAAWVEHAARAVAVAYRTAADILAILSENEELATWRLEHMGHGHR